MGRFGRYMVLIAAWYIPLFIGGDAAWHHFAHHPIPTWVAGVRLIVWLYLVVRDKVPGYERFVGKRGKPSTSKVVPEIPTAPLVGWRAWRIGDGSRGLMSLTSPVSWPAGEAMQAFCHDGRRYPYVHGPAPYVGCACGLYLFSSPQDASVLRLGRQSAVYGPVLTWGRTQVHETGWRSQYAQPLALVRPWFLGRPTRQRIRVALERLGREYGIPVLSLKEAKALAERFRTSGGG